MEGRMGDDGMGGVSGGGKAGNGRQRVWTDRGLLVICGKYTCLLI